MKARPLLIRRCGSTASDARRPKPPVFVDLDLADAIRRAHEEKKLLHRCVRLASALALIFGVAQTIQTANASTQMETFSGVRERYRATDTHVAE